MVDGAGGLQHFEDALFVDDGGEDDGDVVEGGDALADELFELAVGVVVLFDEVPFVDDDDDAFVVALDEGEDVEVLLLEALAGVEHEDAYVGDFDGADGAEDGVEFEVFGDFGFAAEAGGVDEVEVEAEEVVAAVDGVARGACDGGDHGAVLAGDHVDERGFADVGAADDGDAWQAVLGLFLALGEVGHEGVEQFAGAAAGDAGDGVGVAQSQGVEFGEGVHLLRVVHFVHDQEDGFGLAAEHVGDVLVHGGEPLAGVDEEEDGVGLVDGEGDLPAYFLFELVVAAHDVSAGVDDGEVFAVPVGVAVLAVARDAGDGVDDGVACLCEAVEEGGFADIGAADDGYYVPPL